LGDQWEILVAREDAPKMRTRDEAGQTLVMLVIFMMAVLACCAFVIDMGGWYHSKREAQAAADAAALAGAQNIANGTWSTASAQNFAKNQLPGESAVTVQSTYLTANDSVQVTVSYDAPTYFATVFGIKTIHITASARATVESIHQARADMPLAVFGACLPTEGASVVLYGSSNCAGSSSNTGTIQLPAQGETAGSCDSKGQPTYTAVGNGNNDITGIVSGSVSTGMILVGGCLAQTKTGGGPGPGNALDALPWTDQSKWPIQVTIPIVQEAAINGTNGPYTVLGFGYFSITGCSGGTGPSSCGGPSGKEIDATYLGFNSDSKAGNPGAYIPGLGNAIALTS
jgi:Flp pilus assembly protein TadG